MSAELKKPSLCKIKKAEFIFGKNDKEEPSIFILLSVEAVSNACSSVKVTNPEHIGNLRTGLSQQQSRKDIVDSHDLTNLIESYIWVVDEEYDSFATLDDVLEVCDKLVNEHGLPT